MSRSFSCRPGPGLRQRFQRTLLGHRADAQDHAAVDLPVVGGLDHRHLLAHQLKEGASHGGQRSALLQ
jgi:hypothetical protein